MGVAQIPSAAGRDFHVEAVVIEGAIEGGGDVDVFHFSAKAGDLINAECMSFTLRSGDSSVDTDLRVLNQFGAELVRNQGDIERGDSFTIGGGPTGGGNEGNTDSHILDFIIPPTGDDEYRTYFIEVDSPGADTGPYELFVTRFNGAWLEGDFDFDGDVDADDIDFYSGNIGAAALGRFCLLYTSPSPRDQRGSRMPSSA